MKLLGVLAAVLAKTACADDPSAHALVTCEPPYVYPATALVPETTVDRCEAACADMPPHAMMGRCEVGMVGGFQASCDLTFVYEPTGERGCCWTDQEDVDDVPTKVIFRACL